jgi:branched-chain amino acid transport system substrate-binding protein
LAALLAAAIAAPAHAADNVKIGVIYPLTGNAAPAGQSAKDAVELGAEIGNNAHSDPQAFRRLVGSPPATWSSRS